MVKTNPKKIPRTQVDVDRAWEKGVLDGVSNACAIFLCKVEVTHWMPLDSEHKEEA